MECMELQLNGYCPQCAGMGLQKRLRNFYISLDEQILKCESDECMFPYQDEDDSDSELEPTALSQSDMSFIDKILNNDRCAETLQIEQQNISFGFSGIQTVEVKPDLGLTHYIKKEESTLHIPKISTTEYTKTNIDFDIENNKSTYKAMPAIVKREAMPKLSSFQASTPAIKLEVKLDPLNMDKRSTEDSNATDDMPKASIASYFAKLLATKKNNVPTTKPKTKRASKSRMHISKTPTANETKVKLENGMPSKLDDILKMFGNRNNGSS